jgi:hypothetical protein
LEEAYDGVDHPHSSPGNAVNADIAAIAENAKRQAVPSNQRRF